MALTFEQAEQIRQKLLEQIEKLPAEQQAGLKEQVMGASLEQLEQYIKPTTDAGACLFCGIAQGKIETNKIFEDGSVIAFLDQTPSKPGQVILAPKEHFQFLFQIPDHVLWDLVKAMKIITPLVVNATSAEGVSTYFAQGQAAGQMQEHLSINIVPRFEEDKAVFAWGRNPVDKNELEKVAAELREGIEKTLKEEKEKIEKHLRSKMVEKQNEDAEELMHAPEHQP